MKKLICLLLALTVVLAGCRKPAEAPVPAQTLPLVSETTEATEAPEITEPTQATETQPEETEPETTEPEETEPLETEPTATETEPTKPAHSDLYLYYTPVEDVITWFNEVVLDSEFVNGGDPSRVQKWDTPIYYSVHGDPTEEDLAVMESFAASLNYIEGFPGMYPAEPDQFVNLRIHFTDEQGMLDIMGQDYSGLDGAVTFWYDGENRIYDEVICIRNDIDQFVRNSVILEEIYNGLGPVQDTMLRLDSIIYQQYSQPQDLTLEDWLLLRLLYHPDMLCGMDAAQCEAVIRNLYY